MNICLYYIPITVRKINKGRRLYKSYLDLYILAEIGESVSGNLFFHFYFLNKDISISCKISFKFVISTILVRILSATHHKIEKNIIFTVICQILCC